MFLYHGSPIKIVGKLKPVDRFNVASYGPGFYLTPDVAYASGFMDNQKGFVYGIDTKEMVISRDDLLPRNEEIKEFVKKYANRWGMLKETGVEEILSWVEYTIKEDEKWHNILSCISAALTFHNIDETMELLDIFSKWFRLDIVRASGLEYILTNLKNKQIKLIEILKFENDRAVPYGFEMRGANPSYRDARAVWIVKEEDGKYILVCKSGFSDLYDSVFYTKTFDSVGELIRYTMKNVVCPGSKKMNINILLPYMFTRNYSLRE